MKTYVLFFLLLALPLLTMAQNKSSASGKEVFVPGKWEAGLTRETVPFEPGSGKIRTAILPGYHLSPHFLLQAGFTVINLRQRSNLTLPATLTWGSHTGPIRSLEHSAGLYVPFSLQYSFVKNSRRLQPYLVLRTHLYMARIRRAIGHL
jgi:hypothetical protein